MHLTTTQAHAFADHWISSFNSHDPDDILRHYTEDVVFYSPFIIQLNFNETGVVRGREELRKYFAAGLQAYPRLRFRLHHCFTGVQSVVLYYTSVNGRLAAETFVLNAFMQAETVICHYV